MTFDRYRQAVTALLLDFQWIETSLRIVVGMSYDVLRRHAPSPVTFRPKKRMLERDGLGRLIDRYAEVSTNEDMQQRLRALLKERNHCAHQAFILSVEQQQDSSFLENESVRMEAAKERTRIIVTELHEELQQLGWQLSQGAVPINKELSASSHVSGKHDPKSGAT